MNKTSIIILTCNKLDYTKQCIESIREFTTQGTYEIIVVDNASQDDTVEWLKAQPDLRCIYNEQNLGFPKGCNQGIEIATGNYILLLNNDTIVTSNWLANMLYCLNSSEDIGAVGSITNNCSYYQAIKTDYTTLADMHAFARKMNVSNPQLWEERIKLVGFCMLIKKSVVDQIGLLDERFTPGNFEDDDYSLRIRLGGYRLILCNDTFIHHYGSVSFRDRADAYNQLLRTNLLKFSDKWNYDSVEAGAIRLELIKQIEAQATPARILEVGCGAGANILRLQYQIRGSIVSGIEFDPALVRLASVTGAEIQLFDEMKYAPESFDVIVINNCLHQFQYLKDQLGELLNLLKPGGQWIVLSENPVSYRRVRQLLQGLSNHKHPVHPHPKEMDELMDYFELDNVTRTGVKKDISPSDMDFVKQLATLSDQPAGNFEMERYIWNSRKSSQTHSLDNCLDQLRAGGEAAGDLTLLASLSMESIIHHVVTKRNDPVEILNAIATRFYEEGYYENVIPYLQAAFEMAPSDINTLYNLGYILMEMQEYDLAKQYLEQIIEPDQDVIGLLNQLSDKITAKRMERQEINSTMMDRENGIGEIGLQNFLEQAIKLMEQDKDSEIWNELKSLMLNNDIPSADLINMVNQVAQDKVQVSNMLGVKSYESEAYDYVIPLFQNTLFHEDENQDALISLGTFLFQLEQNELSLQYLRKVKNPDTEIKQMINEILEKLPNLSENLDVKLDQNHLQFTGERLVLNNEVRDKYMDVIEEHVKRYTHACQYVQEKKVLDAACGTGYGSLMLKRAGASTVVSVDISEEAVENAKSMYTDSGIHFGVGDVNQLEFPDGSFDVVVSFETIEHIKDGANWIRESSRLLSEGGIFIVSTPNRSVTSPGSLFGEKLDYNPFHEFEFSLQEFIGELLKEYDILELFGQSFIRDMDQGVTKAVRKHKGLSDEVDLFNNRIIRGHELIPLGDVKNAQPKYVVAICRKKIKPEKQYYIKETIPGETKASIIIPVYNKVEYTKQCIEAILANTLPGTYEIIVIDNASTDGTSKLLGQLRGNVSVITNKENKGFVDACNQGAEMAKGEYLVFLNNDTMPQPNWLNELVALADHDPLVGAVGAKLIYPDGRLQEAGGIIWSNGDGWNYGRYQSPKLPMYNYIREVDYCSGACLLIRKSLFNKIGGFDTLYSPAYYEDTDLCFSVRQLGYKVMYNPRAEVIHFEGITAGNDLSSGMKRYQVINRNKFCEKWAFDLQAQYQSSSLNVCNAAERKKGKNILVIDPTMPMYDRASGSLRLFNILKILKQEGHAITYIARYAVGQEKYVDELERLGIEVFPTDVKKIRQMGYQAKGWEFDVSKLLGRKHYDIAWLSFYDIAEQYLEEIRNHSSSTQIIIDTVDVHFLREFRMAETLADSKQALKATQTKLRELQVYNKADLVISVTENDADVLKTEGLATPICIIPNIHDSLEKTNGFEEREGILFVGNFNHNPNLDAVQYFVNEVWRNIKDQLPDAKFYIVGNKSKELCQFNQQDVLVLGYVQDLEEVLQKVRVSVAPLRYGAGIKGKIGEALAAGLPVVTTTIGAEGMGLVQGEQALISDNPIEFANHVIELYTNKEQWNKLSRNGKPYVNQKYGTEAIRKSICSIVDI